MRRRCRFCGAVIEVNGRNVNIEIPFGESMCDECIDWIRNNLDPPDAPDATVRPEAVRPTSPIEVVPIEGKVAGKVKNDKYRYPHPYSFKILDACGLAVFTLNAKFTTSADKVRGMYMMTLYAGEYIMPVHLEKQTTINKKIAATVSSDISFSVLVPHGGYVEYDVSVAGKLLTLR